MSANEMLDSYCTMTENALDRIFDAVSDSPDVLKRSMYYSISAGGKRIRPCLMLEFYRLLGKKPTDILNFACAVEMIHTYSLIHDDLPCMDNDDMRRGKPSNHIAYGESTALLAGDALLTLAFETAATVNECIKPENTVKAIGLLAKAAGMSNMVGGQVLDLESEDKQIDLAQLEKIQQGKTVAMIKVSALIASVLAQAEDAKRQALCCYCDCLGRAFQIRDDILDVIGDEKIFGKPIGSDSEMQKNTYVSLLGLDKAQQLTDKLSQRAKKALDIFGADADNLRELADLLCTRNK